MHRVRDHRRRASAYALVVGTATIVAVIGMAAVAAVRVTRRSAESATQAAQARHLAGPAIEWGILQINDDPNWRSTFTSGVWGTEKTLGRALLTWRVVDEDQGDLTTTVTGPVRIYGRATIGNVVRVSRVLLRSEAVASANLLQNGFIEEGSSPWTCGGACDLAEDTTTVYEAGTSLSATNRSSPLAGPQQDVTDVINSGVEYYTEVWVQAADVGGASFILSIEMDTTDGAQSVTLAPVVTAAEWTLVAGKVTPVWTGTLLFPADCAVSTREANWSGLRKNSPLTRRMRSSGSRPAFSAP